MECETAGIVRKRNQNHAFLGERDFVECSKMLGKVKSIWPDFAWHFLGLAN